MTTVPRHPATAIQRGMWLAAQIDPIGSEYTIATAYELTGPLDPGALQTGLDALMRRHPILRSGFTQTGQDALSVLIRPAAPCLITHTDLSHLPYERARRTARQQIEAAARVPFDMERDLLLRAQLLRLGEQEHILSLQVHHAVCDGASMQLLLEDWSRCYQAALHVAPCPDFAPHEPSYFWHAHVPADETAAGLTFWRERLKGVEPLALPFVGRSGRGGAGRRFTVDARLLAQVDAFARREHTTRYVVLLTAFAAVLGHLSGTQDVAVGTTMSTRTTEEAESVVGPLFNTLVLRENFAAERSFGTAVQSMTETVCDTFEYARVPFEEVLETTRAQSRSTSPNPLFNVFFELDHSAPAVPDLPGVDGRLFDFADHAPKTDAMCVLTPHGDGLAGTLTYRVAVCDSEGARALAEGFTAFLDAALAHPDAPLHALPVMPARTLTEVTARLPDGGRTEIPDVGVAQLFEEQVRRTPQAVAVRELGGARAELTFRELNSRANRLARHLCLRGAGPGDRVAVLLRRTPDLLVAFLAVWKAGAAYVPLDHDFPTPRLSFVTEDSEARLIVTERTLVEQAMALGPPLVTVDEEVEAIAALDSSDLPPSAGPRSLAYVIHTSGSTGRPKGVLVEHRGLVNFLGWCVGRYAAHGDGGAPLFSSVAFDMVVPNLYTPLLTGQAVSLVPEETPPDGLGLMLASGAPYSFIKMTPGHLELLTQQLTGEQAEHLAELLVVGADAFPSAILRAWRRLAPDLPVLNEYGPTEASVANCVHQTAPHTEIESPKQDAPAILPIGRPIENTTVYVLDGERRPVPPGVVGELYIGGDCVARGYANRPETTAERFLPDPFGSVEGRLYRTGDLGRWLPDGELEFLGRTDQQVKIRGYRIEPGEVESELASLPTVRHALVVVDTTPSGQAALVAYVVPAGGTVASSMLREELARSLPAHLVPTKIVEISAIPLNENGKIDRGRLPAPGWGTQAADAPEGACSETEEAVAGVWAQILGLERAVIGPHDNFFELGGNSLLVLSAVSRLRSVLGTPLTFVKFLEEPTVAGLAARVAEDRGATATLGGPSRSLSQLSEGGEGIPVVLAHPLGGTLFCYRHLVETLRGVAPLHGLTLAALRGAEVEEDESLEDVTGLYAAEIAETVEGPLVVAGWSAGAVVAFELARQLRASGKDVERLVLLDPSTPAENTRWRGYVRQLQRIQRRLDLATEGEREAEFQAVLRTDLFQAMGIDPATCRDYSLFPQDILRIWLRQLRILGGYDVPSYGGPMAILTSQEHDGDEQVLLVSQWQEHARGPVKHIQVGGSHLSMLQLPAVASTAAALREFVSTRGAN